LISIANQLQKNKNHNYCRYKPNISVELLFKNNFKWLKQMVIVNIKQK